MKILASEKLSEHKFKDNNGYLICTDCILSRTGKQTYHRDEVFCDGSNEEVEIDRLEDEVFSPQSLASFENCPVCINHPDVNVTPDNHNELSVGFVRNVRKGDYEGNPVMIGDLVITDAKAIDLIENDEMTELSCGYDCDIKDEENPQQRNIRGNHIALCEQGRAGIARIIDSIDDAEYIYNKDGDKIQVVKEQGKLALLWITNHTIEPYVIVNSLNKKDASWQYGSYFSSYDKAKKEFEKLSKRKDSIDDENINDIEKQYKQIRRFGNWSIIEILDKDLVKAFNNCKYIVGKYYNDTLQDFDKGSYYKTLEKAEDALDEIHRKERKDFINDRVSPDGLDFKIIKNGYHWDIKKDGKVIMTATNEDEAYEFIDKGEASEIYKAKTKSIKEDKYIIKSKNKNGMYINQKGIGEYIHYSKAKRFNKKEAEVKANMMNKNSKIYNWTIEKVNDSINDTQKINKIINIISKLHGGY